MSAQRANDLFSWRGLPQGDREDKELTLAFQRGEKGAYQAIYDRYAARVHGVCWKMLGQRDDAQEAVQETFLRVYQALARFNGRYQLGPWITRIATNVCLDQLRARSRRPQSVELVETNEVNGSGDENEQDPERVFIRNSEGRRVRKVLQSLPPLHRAAIVLRDFEGLTYEEISISLGITEPQVKALLHRARKGFRRSWTRLSLLFPWRTAERFRNVEATTREQAAQVLSSSAQTVPACAPVLQQCGQYVAERVAPVVTAAIVGVAAGGAIASPHELETPRQPAMSASQPAAPQEVFGLGLAGGEKGQAPRVASERAGREAAATSAPGEALPTPQVSPGPTVSPSPSAQPSASPPSPSPSPSAAPTPGTSGEASTGSNGEKAPAGAPSVAIGFDRGQPIPKATPKSYDGSVDCGAWMVSQRMDTMVRDGSASHPGVAVVRMSGESLWIELTITKNYQQVYYSGGASRTALSRSSNTADLTFEGSYSTADDADRAGLPRGGSFKLAITLDCAASSVVTESIVFATS